MGSFKRRSILVIWLCLAWLSEYSAVCSFCSLWQLYLWLDFSHVLGLVQAQFIFCTEYCIFFLHRTLFQWRLLSYCISGTLGYIGASAFVKKIYSTVKID